MTEIKRFDMRGNTWPSDDGSIVSYKDHAAIVAALQEQVRALAVDGAIMHAAIDQTIGWQQSVDAGNTESVRCLVAIQCKTPRIDAALREIRAQGAIDARNALVVAGDGADIYAVVTDVAARIRAGEQP